MIKTLACVVTICTIACSSSTDTGPRVATLEVTPNPIDLLRGDSAQVSVNALDGQGQLVTGIAVSFHSGNSAIATVSNVGMVRSVQKGTTAITVSGGGGSTQVPVAVTVPVGGVSLTPVKPLLHPGDNVQMTARLVDIDGDPVTPQPSFQYSSSDETIVTIDPSSGLVHAVGPIGSTFVSAQGGGFQYATQVTVLDPGVLVRRFLSGSPQFLGVFGNTSYVARPFDNRVQILNLSTDAFTDSIVVGSLPCGVVFNHSGSRAYVANQTGDNISIINTASKLQIGTITLHGDPLPVIMPAGDSVLFVTTNANKLFKINLVTNTVVDSLPLVATSHHMFVHPNDTLVYVATRDGGTVMEINWRTMTTARTFTLGVQTLGMELAPDRSELYVTTTSANAVYIVKLSDGSITSAPVLAGASTIALSADGTQLYVGELFAGQVEVLNRATRAHVKTIVTGGISVRDMATDVPRNRVLVTNESGWVDIVR